MEKEWKFYGSEFNTGFDIEIVRETPDGLELWGQNVCTHPWKEREYAPVFVRKITRKELEAVLEKKRKRKQKEAKRREEEKKQAKRYKEWLKKIAREFPVDPFQGYVVDDYGNFLFPIPRRLAGVDKKTFRRWLEEEYKKDHWID